MGETRERWEGLQGWEGLARILIQGQVQSQVLILTLNSNLLLVPEIPSEKPSSFPSQENTSVTQVNFGADFFS